MEFTEYVCNRTGISYYSNEQFTQECRNIVLLGHTKDNKQVLKCTIHASQVIEGEKKGIIFKPLVSSPAETPIPSPAQVPISSPVQAPIRSPAQTPIPAQAPVSSPPPLPPLVPPALARAPTPLQTPTPTPTPPLQLPKLIFSLDTPPPVPPSPSPPAARASISTPAQTPTPTSPLQLSKLSASPSSLPVKKQVVILNGKNGKKVHVELLHLEGVNNSTSTRNPSIDPTDRLKVNQLENGKIFNRAPESRIKKFALKRHNSTSTNPTRTAEKEVQVAARSVSKCVQTDPVRILSLDSIDETDSPVFDIQDNLIGDDFLTAFLSSSNEIRDMGTMLNSSMRDSAKNNAAKEKFYVDFKTCLEFNVKGNLPIHDAVLMNDSDRIRRQCVVLKARQEDVNIPNNDGYTPLQLAVLNDISNENIIQLLRYKADLGVKDSEGNNVLHLAVENNRGRVLNVLLEEANRVNFDIDSFNFEGFTPLMLCAMTQKVHLAQTLLEHKAKVNTRDLKSGRTALFHAAENFDLTMVQVLLNYEADTKIRNFFGTSPHDAMYEIEEMPADIKTLILGRDIHARAQLKRKYPASKTYSGAHKAKSSKTADRSGSGSDSNTFDYPEMSTMYVTPLKSANEIKMERDPKIRVYGGVKKEQNVMEDVCRDSKVVVRKFSLNRSKLKEEQNVTGDDVVVERTLGVRDGGSLLKKGLGMSFTGASTSTGGSVSTNHPSGSTIHPSGSTIKKLNIIPTYQKITNPRYRVYDKSHLNILD